MRLVLDNTKAEEFSENEEDAYLSAAMEEVKDGPLMSEEQAVNFRKWLKAKE